MFPNLYSIKLYFKYLPNLIFLSLSFLVNLGIWVWLLWNIRPQDELIYLHYNIVFGVDLFDQWYKVLYVPILGLFILIVNAFLGWIMFNKDKFVAQLVNFITLFCQIFLLIFSALLVFLNV